MTTVNFIDATRMRLDQIKNIKALVPGPYSINEIEKEWLLSNSHLFTSLNILDLSYQDIDDDFIVDICLVDFERLEVIDLSYNPKITAASLDSIFDSQTLGSKRSKLTMSGRYDAPDATIKVFTKGTAINAEDRKRYDSKARFNFWISYDHSDVIGVKLLDIADERIQPCAQCHRI